MTGQPSYRTIQIPADTARFNNTIITSIERAEITRKKIVYLKFNEIQKQLNIKIVLSK